MQGALLALLLVCVTATVHAAAPRKASVSGWPDSYDEFFRKNAKHYFGAGFDWRWFKAQGIAESGLEPAVTSKSGARGIMQILPSTYREIQRKNPHLKDMTSPRWNIAAGIYYDRVLYKRWDAPPPGEERLYFAFGSYNAGYSRILNSLHAADPPTSTWEQVEAHVPGQTRHYVRRIRTLMGKH